MAAKLYGLSSIPESTSTSDQLDLNADYAMTIDDANVMRFNPQVGNLKVTLPSPTKDKEFKIINTTTNLLEINDDNSNPVCLVGRNLGGRMVVICTVVNGSWFIDNSHAAHFEITLP